VGQRKYFASEPLDIASSYKILKMRRVFAKQSVAYFRFLVCKNMSMGSCMGVVAAFRFLKPLSDFH